jgi:hypothetical protein
MMILMMMMTSDDMCDIVCTCVMSVCVYVCVCDVKRIIMFDDIVCVYHVVEEL